MGDTTSASGRKPKPLPPFLRGYLRVVDYVSHDLLGGPKVMKMCVPINFQKGATLFFSLACMAYYDRWDSPTAWMYTALHGSYGLCWLLKEMVFPDPKWQDYITLGGAAGCIVSVLAPYWLAPWLLMRSNYEASPMVLGIATIMYALGLVTMIGSDAQKYFTLQHKKGLITTGFFARVRHPNYSGEMMVYASFALLSGHCVPWCVLAYVWTGLFLPYILRKEASMSRHPEWNDYKRRTGYVLPKLW